MKSRILVFTLLLCSSIGFAQNKERLSQSEINANESARAVAYNFVNSIITEDYLFMYQLITPEFQANIINEMRESHTTFSELFSSDYMHDIVEMRPVLKMGYRIVIDDMDVLDPNDFDEYKGLPMCSVAFDCVDAHNNYYDDTYGYYDTTVDVYLVKLNGAWKVFGFE